jgi:hypothetical protein
MLVRRDLPARLDLQVLLDRLAQVAPLVQRGLLGRFGLQIVKSSSYLRDKTVLALTCHVAILQVDAVGDPSYSFTGYKRNKLGEFFGILIADYGADQESVRYMAPLFPGIDPLIDIRRLARYQACDGSWSFGTGILYIPPKGMTYKSMLQRQAFRTRAAYSENEREGFSNSIVRHPMKATRSDVLLPKF